MTSGFYQEKLKAPLLKFIEKEEEDQLQYVFSVDNGSLPTNIRTVFLTKEQFPPATVDHKMSNTKQRTWALAAVTVLILILSFIITMTMWKMYILDGTQITDSKAQSLNISATDSLRTGPIRYRPFMKDRSQMDIRGLNRAPCGKFCWQYSAFRFRSKCVGGFCECSGKGYQKLTCLPEADGCAIAKQETVSYSSAFLSGKDQALYTCNPRSSEDTPIHVFSMFRNKKSVSTIVDIQRKNNNSSKSIVLVLSSYQKTDWIVRTDDEINLEKIILISTQRNNQVGLQWNEYPKSKTEALITRFRSQTGHGDDTCAGRHSIKLIRTITQEVGHISSFIGSRYADHWILDLDRYSSIS